MLWEAPTGFLLESEGWGGEGSGSFFFSLPLWWVALSWKLLSTRCFLQPQTDSFSCSVPLVKVDCQISPCLPCQMISPLLASFCQPSLHFFGNQSFPQSVLNYSAWVFHLNLQFFGDFLDFPFPGSYLPGPWITQHSIQMPPSPHYFLSLNLIFLFMNFYVILSLICIFVYYMCPLLMVSSMKIGTRLILFISI